MIISAKIQINEDECIKTIWHGIYTVIHISILNTSDCIYLSCPLKRPN